MQSVSDRWYIWYSRVSLVLASLLALTSLLNQFLPQLIIDSHENALSYMTLAFALAQVLYILFVHSRETKNGNVWQATLILYLMQALTIISLMHTTGGFGSFYMTGWVMLALLSGLFGVNAIIGMCFVITLYFVISSSNQAGVPNFDTASLIGLLGTYMLGILSYLIFNRYYDRNTNTQITRLSGALKSKQLQSEILVQSITDGVIVTDNEGNISNMNESAAKLTGWSVDESLGLNVHNIVTFKDDQDEVIPNIENPFDSVITNKQPISGTYNLESRTKSKYAVSCVVSPITTDKSVSIAGTVAVMRDVSAARAEEQRRADFISTASHEMRTPVAAIEGYLALALNDKVSKIDTKARSYLEKAHSSTQHLGKLFQDLLTSAKAEDGRLVSHPSVIEMGTYLEQVADSLRFSAEKKGLLVEFTIGTSAETGDKVVTPLYYSYADPDRIREVITNLFDNAVKYTETGKISIGLTGNDEVVQFFVKDTGPGISKEDIPHLFQKFYRVDNSSTRTVGGTGLGLFICKKIVELYKGRIWVESGEGKGSTFYINLPRISSQKARDLQSNQSST
jgi:two-component system sensor histidine kinase VicK